MDDEKHAKKLEAHRKYNAKNQEKIRDYYWKNREERLAYQYGYNTLHAEEKREQRRLHRLANPLPPRQRKPAQTRAQKLEKDRERRRLNIEYVRAREQAWRQAHPERVAASNARRVARRRGAKISDFTTYQWEKLIQLASGRCVYCGVTAKLTQDHIIALSRGGDHTARNIVPACQPCNARKGQGPPLLFHSAFVEAKIRMYVIILRLQK